MSKKVQWDGQLESTGYQILSNLGGAIVSPTKVGYIIMTSDEIGLRRKFEAKNRNLNKPGVVLCSSVEQLKMLAEINSEIEDFYRQNDEQKTLIGCILPWKDSGQKFVPKDGSEKLIMDSRGTSCFVINFGIPSEQIVKEMWEKQQKLVFASSANPSGQGNRGKVENIGEKIETEVDLVIAADEYVFSVQPDKDESSRYEQGVMVSMVDTEGKLIPQQHKQRGVYPRPILIRKGLDVDKIMVKLANIFPSWDYRHGEYY